MVCYKTIFFEYRDALYHSYVTDILPILYRLRSLQASFLSRNINVGEANIHSKAAYKRLEEIHSNIGKILIEKD